MDETDETVETTVPKHLNALRDDLFRTGDFEHRIDAQTMAVEDLRYRIGLLTAVERSSAELLDKWEAAVIELGAIHVRDTPSPQQRAAVESEQATALDEHTFWHCAP